jgi:peptide deformylase
MAIREVRLLGDPVLRRKCTPVDTPAAELQSLIADMFETMYAEEGVGLAAPQIGLDMRLIVIDTREEESEPHVLINPEILEQSEETEKGEEGCLSMPGLKDMVERSARVIIEATDAKGERVRIQADELLARVIQHEIDHIEGILFIDRVSPLKRKMLIKRWEKVKPERAGRTGT